jgi:hypothetical protein
VTTEKKKPDENYDEISVCEVECQTHGDDTDSVATLRLSLIESCETEPSGSSSITDSTNNVKNSDCPKEFGSSYEYIHGRKG